MSTKKSKSQADETAGVQYQLKDNRLHIKGVGLVEKVKGKPLSQETLDALFELCKKNGMSKALAIQKYLEVFVPVSEEQTDSGLTAGEEEEEVVFDND